MLTIVRGVIEQRLPPLAFADLPDGEESVNITVPLIGLMADPKDFVQTVLLTFLTDFMRDDDPPGQLTLKAMRDRLYEGRKTTIA